jgi:hypothetical protein
LTSNDDYILEILENVGWYRGTGDRRPPDRDAGGRTRHGRPGARGVVAKLDMLKARPPVGMETISLTGLDIPREVLDMVPGEVAQRYKVVPVFKNENVLTVALGDPWTWTRSTACATC